LRGGEAGIRRRGEEEKRRRGEEEKRRRCRAWIFFLIIIML